MSAEVVSKEVKKEEDRSLQGNIHIKKGGEDKYEYKHFMLDNGAKVVLIRRDDLEKSAVSISISVGAREDPVDSEGMAHFLEHMLFMGSEKYPKESGYREYILKKGGRCNASTMIDRTNFFYDVLPEAFEESLDVFSGFFTSPLLRKDSIEREVKAVDSEHSKNILLEVRRHMRLVAMLRKEGSELGKFTTGSKNTLFGDDLRDRVHDFWKRKYSAEKFCIVLGGRQSFDVLEGYARKYFSDIPVREKEIQEDSGIGYFHYDERYTGKLVRIKPALLLPGTKSPEVLTIIITIPEIISIYKKKVDSYILFLLETTKQGGFVQTMKSRGYLSDVAIKVNRRMMKMNTEINVVMTLLPKGKERISEIKSFFKEYLKVARDNTCEEVFKMLRKIKENALKNLEGKSLLEQVIITAGNGQYFPMEDVVVSDFVYEDYDDELMKRMLDIMLDDSKWIHIYSTEEGPFDRTEKHYGLEYGITEYNGFDETDNEYKDTLKCIGWPFKSISSDDIKCNEADGNVLPRPEDIVGKTLALENVKKHGFEDLRDSASAYIKENEDEGGIMVGESKMEVFPVNDVDGKIFSCGLRDLHGELRYFVNKELETKEVVLYITVWTEDNTGDIDRATRCSTHFSGFSTEFMDKYKHEIGLLNVTISLMLNDGTTMMYMANGPSPGIYAFAELFFREYKESSVKCTESFIESSKCRMENTYTNLLKNLPPYGALVPEVSRRLNGIGFQTRELIESIQRIKSTEELLKTEKGYIRFMVSGNGSFSEAVELYRRIRENLSREPLGRRRIYPVDENGKYIEGSESASIDEIVYAETEDENNSAVGVFHDLGPAADKDISSVAILVSMMLRSKFFDQLRTKECLGYIVSMAFGCLDNARTIYYIVQSEIKPEDIHSRIERFIKDSYEIVNEMSSEEYADYVNSAALSVKETGKNLISYFSDIFEQWMQVEFNLRRRDEVSSMIREIKKEKVLEFLKKEHKKVVAYAVHGNKKK